ncbi:MAG: SH3 domain-containing protein [Chloroflexota bacterium]
MKFQHLRLAPALLVFILAFAACAPEENPPTAADIQTAIAETLTAAPGATNTPPAEPDSTLQPSPTIPLASATNDPGRPVDAVVNVGFLNMRSGPSTFFDVIETLEEGAELSAVSRLPDNTWVEVEYTPEGGELVTGWMFAQYLDFSDEITLTGIKNFPASQIVQGRVVDENDEPINGVLIAVISSTEGESLRADTTSDLSGSFITYLPEEMFGILDVQVIGPICGTPLMDENCQVSSHILMVERFYISIPQGEQEILFPYHTAAFTLTGTVVDRHDRGVPQINITAVRDDGAISYGLSREDGEFYLPISEGIWEIFTVEFDPRNQGDSLIITVADRIPEPIKLLAPD